MTWQSLICLFGRDAPWCVSTYMIFDGMRLLRRSFSQWHNNCNFKI